MSGRVNIRMSPARRPVGARDALVLGMDGDVAQQRIDLVRPNRFTRRPADPRRRPRRRPGSTARRRRASAKRQVTTSGAKAPLRTRCPRAQSRRTWRVAQQDVVERLPRGPGRSGASASRRPRRSPRTARSRRRQARKRGAPLLDEARARRCSGRRRAPGRPRCSRAAATRRCGTREPLPVQHDDPLAQPASAPGAAWTRRAFPRGPPPVVPAVAPALLLRAEAPGERRAAVKPGALPSTTCPHASVRRPGSRHHRAGALTAGHGPRLYCPAQPVTSRPAVLLVRLAPSAPSRKLQRTGSGFQAGPDRQAGRRLVDWLLRGDVRPPVGPSERDAAVRLLGPPGESRAGVSWCGGCCGRWGGRYAEPRRA